MKNKKEDEKLLACREKYWFELSNEEKIERLREYVSNVENLIDRVGILEGQLLSHQHLEGRVFTPLLSGAIIGRKTNCWNCEECKKKVRI